MPLGLYFILEKAVRSELNIMVDKGKRVEAVGYMRTSSAANVGDGKDSEARQRKAIEGYAKATGMVVVDWFYDAAVSGADAIEARPGFAALLARIAGNSVRTIIVERANRFARDLMVQEVGFAMLRDLGVTLIAADTWIFPVTNRSALAEPNSCQFISCDEAPIDFFELIYHPWCKSLGV